MNYLAHAYLSFGNQEILVGNMISDFVKGKKQFDYPETIQKGIRLHRLIDTFTDTHPATREGKTYFKSAVGTYSGAFMDVVYDHFLALDTEIFAEEDLSVFAQLIYAQLTDQQSLLPEKFAHMLPYMRSQNWLYHYRYADGIEKSFGGLVRRAAYLDDSSAAFILFTKNYHQLKSCYDQFFPDVRAYASAQFARLLMH